MPKQTPLTETHRTMGAKMVEFSGWEMPLHYGSQIDEHRRVRNDAGMFDISHMLVIDLRGREVRDFLRYLLANDVARFKRSGQALYSCMLNEAGGVLDDLIVYFLGEEWFRLVVNAATAAKDLNWLRLQRGDLTCEIIPRTDLAIIAVQGPKARSRVGQALPQLKLDTIAPFHAVEIGQFFIARTGYTGEDGFEILLPGAEAVPLWKSLRAQGIALAGLGARDTLRLEAGMNLYGQDMDETTSPLESGLASTVDIRPGRNFIGKMAIASKSISSRMLGLVLRDRGVLRAGQNVITARGSGAVTSGGFSPTMNASIALARVPIDVAAGEAVKVEVRDKMLRAETVTYPFVRNGRILIENVNV